MNNGGVYYLYGLRVYSEIALPAPRAQSESPPYDVRFEWGHPEGAIDDPPTGAAVAGFKLPDGRGYSVTTTTSGGYLICFSSIGEFWIRADGELVRIHTRADLDPGLVALFLVGNVIACVLLLAGEPVLHASAVQIGDCALAFVGASGMGKSTLAALLCANGARLITDDLLRLLPDGSDFRCFAGTGQLRLRQGAALVAENFPATMRATTPDDRIAVSMEENRSMPRLAAVIIPRVSRESDTLSLRKLDRSASLFHLMAFPRLTGLQQRAQFQRQMDLFGRIAMSVPMFEAEIPWSQPLPTELAAELIQMVVQH